MGRDAAAVSFRELAWPIRRRKSAARQGHVRHERRRILDDLALADGKGVQVPPNISGVDS
ncbi:hypothetical protein [Rhodococcus sp. P1Y]|uniref:hypothetical protein n=1 Tax=Rhodococcus sp. P1Y TaxID=1302308 RepID=UPI001F18B335|nr:hypothetical protein [Rhodococcus sp. P1Y]